MKNFGFASVTAIKLNYQCMSVNKMYAFLINVLRVTNVCKMDSYFVYMIEIKEKYLKYVQKSLFLGNYITPKYKWSILLRHFVRYVHIR